ncbi:MAG: hypothetical protein ABIH46_02470 [Chloroflexota bacterium]
MVHLPEIPGLPRPVRLEDVPRLLQSAETLMDDLNVRAQAILDRLETVAKQMERIPEGAMCTIGPLTITGNQWTELKLKEEPDADYRAWAAATITNDEDSDNNILVLVNTLLKKPRELRPSESLDIDFHAPLLKTIALRCNNLGESASVWIVGNY